MEPVSFVKWKFNQMLVVGTLTMAVNYIVMLSGSVIVGNLVGADGLAGINVCTPVFGGVGFLASLLSVGSALVFSRAMGAFDAKRAAGVCSQSLMIAVAMGLLIGVGMMIAKDAFFDFTGVTEAVRQQAAHYWSGQTFVLALTPAVLLVEALVYADGDNPVAAAAGAVHVIGAIGLSVLFTKFCGHAGGAAFGTATAMLLALLVAALHLLRRENHLIICRHWSGADLRETIAASLADSTIYLCWGALILIVNRFTVTEFGQELLPVVALAASIVEFSIVFDGVGEALIAVGGMYAGEGNRPALRVLANHSALVATAEGLVCGILLWLLAPEIVALYGLRGEPANLAGEALHMARTLAMAMPFMGLMMMMNTHYLVVRHIPFAVSVTVMKDFICPCLGALTLGTVFGLRGMWGGFTAGYAAAAAYPFLFVLIRHGRDLFPWLIEQDDGREIDFTVRLTENRIAAAKKRIGDFLRRHAVGGDEALAAVEAAARSTIAANGRAAVRTEYYIAVENTDTVRLIVRDNGRPLPSPGGKYLSSLGCNRTEYRFKAPQFPEARLNYLQSYILSRIGAESASRMFNLAKLFRLRKGIDLERLSTALTTAAETHGALHTVLRRGLDGEFIQRRELPAGSIRCPIVKISEAELLANRASLVKSFKIDGGTLFDAKIFDCGDGRAYLLSNFHHLICDGYSFPLILANAHRIWNGETLENDTYYEVLARREERSSLPVAVAGRSFMRETMKEHGFTTLPTADFHGEPGYGAIEIPIPLPAGFDDILARCRATRHHVFLAASAIALRKITGASDILIDWVFHGRVSKDELKTVGAFMVDLPLIFDGAEDMTAADVIALVKRSTFNGIKGVNIFRDVTDLNPTGQDRLTFIYQDEWGELMSPGPVREDGPYAWMIEETIPLSAPSAATENPFNVEIMEHRDATRIFVEYNTGLYSESTARNYARCFIEALNWLMGAG